MQYCRDSSHEQCRARPPPVKRSRREVPLVQTQKITPPPPQVTILCLFLAKYKFHLLFII
jgi:hypothetical protein